MKWEGKRKRPSHPGVKKERRTSDVAGVRASKGIWVRRKEGRKK